MDQQTGISRELAEAIDHLHASLAEAAAATARIRGMLPRIAALSTVLGELESIIASGRETASATAAVAIERPVPVRGRRGRAQAAPPPAPEQAATEAWTAAAPVPDPAPEPEQAASAPDAPSPFIGGIPGAAAEELIAFRLEFEARPGPLDLRAVDDAVSEHPAVRDVALLDYDGRRATLKVWIESSASAAAVQDALSAKAREVFTGGDDVSIIALEDVA